MTVVPAAMSQGRDRPRGLADGASGSSWIGGITDLSSACWDSQLACQGCIPFGVRVRLMEPGVGQGEIPWWEGRNSSHRDTGTAGSAVGAWFWFGSTLALAAWSLEAP